jgi:hypothetical protein
MRVRELIAALADADPDSVVVFLDSYADSDESDEIREVRVPSKPWTSRRVMTLVSSMKSDAQASPGPMTTDSMWA